MKYVYCVLGNSLRFELARRTTQTCDYVRNSSENHVSRKDGKNKKKLQMRPKRV